MGPDFMWSVDPERIKFPDSDPRRSSEAHLRVKRLHIPKENIDWKKTKLFRFRWNWVEEKKLRGIRLQISSFTRLEGGGDFVDTVFPT